MSGLFRGLPMCVFLFRGVWLSAAKITTDSDISKHFEPERANLRYEAVFDSLYPDYFSSFLSFSPLSRTLI